MGFFKVLGFISVIVLLGTALSFNESAQPWMTTAKALAGQVYGHAAFPFVFLFIFRYLRLVVHLFSFWCLYKPAPVPAFPKYLSSDCTIILPTVEPSNPDFKECIESCLRNNPGAIIVVTVGRMVRECRDIVQPYKAAWPNTDIKVFRSPVANKRTQVATAIPFVKTKLVVLLDDHVFWPSLDFLRTAIAPFEDESVGAVGTNKRVRRTDTGYNARSFFNMLGAIYLERHNFEIRSTNAIDGGVFVISGRTSLIRAEIVQDPSFLQEFTNEHFFFNKLGPLNADDDNCITRWLVNHGWNIKIQYCKDAMIETTLGTYPKFMSQCLRWVRTTWRSNSTSLFSDRTVWYRQPWCVYAVYISSFFNFALFMDSALVYTLKCSPYGSSRHISMLAGWIFCTKMVKLTPYFLRHPQDLLMLPGYFAFAYYHSLIKLYAGLSFFVTAWGGRNLGAIDVSLADRGDNDNDDDDHQPPMSPDSSSTNVAGRRSGSLGSLTRRSASSQVSTPWGQINGRNLHTRPANVLETQYGRQQRSSLAGRTQQVQMTPASARFMSPDPYQPLNTPIDYRYIMSNTGRSNSFQPPHYHPSASTPSPAPQTGRFSASSFQPPSYTTSSSSSSSSSLSPASSSFRPPRYTSSPSPSLSAASMIFTPVHNHDTYTPSSSALSSVSTPLIPTTNSFVCSEPIKVDYKTVSQPYGRHWVRGKNCERLHYDGCRLTGSGACKAVDIWDLPRTVVPGHPRM